MTEKVWTMLESRVYHARRDCPALNRVNRHWSPRQETRAGAARHYYPKVNPCRICASTEQESPDD